MLKIKKRNREQKRVKQGNHKIGKNLKKKTKNKKSRMEKMEKLKIGKSLKQRQFLNKLETSTVNISSFFKNKIALNIRAFKICDLCADNFSHYEVNTEYSQSINQHRRKGTTLKFNSTLYALFFKSMYTQRYIILLLHELANKCKKCVNKATMNYFILYFDKCETRNNNVQFLHFF